MSVDNIEQDNLADSKTKAKTKAKPIIKLVVDPGTSLSKILSKYRTKVLGRRETLFVLDLNR